MSDTPLKPCPVPWCASQHVTTRHYDAKRRQHWVECFKCNFKTPQMPSKTNAIAAWNTRQPTQSDALQTENEQLRHDLERQMTIANEHVNEVERLRVEAQAQYDRGYYDGRKMDAMEERAKIVAWLWGMGLHNINDIADDIEAGEHLK